MSLWEVSGTPNSEAVSGIWPFLVPVISPWSQCSIVLGGLLPQAQPPRKVITLPTATALKAPLLCETSHELSAESAGPGTQHSTDVLLENSPWNQLVFRYSGEIPWYSQIPSYYPPHLLKSTACIYCKFPVLMNPLLILIFSLLFILPTYFMGTYIPYIPISKVILLLEV